MSGYNYVTWYNATGLLIRLGVPVRPSDSIGLFGTWADCLGSGATGEAPARRYSVTARKIVVVTSAGHFSKPHPHFAAALIPAMLIRVNPSIAFPAGRG